MGALTETSSNITEFAGDYKMAVVEVDGAAGTGSTLTIDEFSSIIGAVGSLKESPTADCCGVTVEVDTGTANQLNVILVEGDGTPCTQNALDSYIIAIGK